MTSEQFWARVHAFVARIDTFSYYQVLRVAPDATQDAIRGSFYHWAPQLHPDRFARETDPQRRWALSLLYARMREAFEVLSDPVRRREYDAGLSKGVLRVGNEPARRAAPPRMPVDPRARRFYEMGVERQRAGALAEARLQFQMALQLEPDSRLIRDALAQVGGEAPSKPPPDAVAAPPAVSASAVARGPQPQPSAESRAVQLARRLGAGGRGATPAAAPAPAAAPPPAAPPTVAPARARERGRPSGAIAPIVGIDFGTTRSSVSVAIGDRVYVLPDEKGRTLHPSIVHYREDGLTLCGWDARELVYKAPRRTIASPKRLLGKSYTDPTVAGMLHTAPYKTLAGPNDTIVIELKGVHAAVPQICAQVLAHVRDVAERRLDRRVEQAVFSIPVTYGEPERAAVSAMARVAGIEVAALIDEPVAAAMAYGFGKDRKEIVAVYDFGGGTFDFTVIDMEGYHFQVLTRGGDSWLGGDDFDSALAQAVANALWRATGVELQNRQVEWQRLLFACERAKRELSLRTEAQIVVDNLIESPKRVNLRQKIERPVLERLCGELLQRSLEICRTALARVGLDPTDVHQVVVSGGVSHMPFVRDELSRFFGRPLAPLVNPDEAICLGAGLRAAQLSKQPVLGVGRY